ncbi:uncharacterized protein MONBRDRAFT_20821 [Monosiga brevicollis MX1]|uniref:UV excision repair protein RAD23 n=1 Tax=Monosiga brevicollis TaxID=81824 RepID=A9UXZ9_MONBE|nr:uncharacterized protein MONBRDRAFT_20821 [Monosiga brevicollis MX1]EDQ89934.1 predicted protein [Monosiga brevicollis MX1]|eukprot:XP_001745356.1 hypothetical protein [Monosiga brevicollis MX1]
MKVTIKTIKDGTFDLQMGDDATIGEVKAAIEQSKGDKYPKDGLKVIYQGKVLGDSDTLASANFQEKDFLVVMASKAKPKPAATPAPAEPTASNSAAPSAAASTEQPAQSAQSASGAASEDDVNRLMNMGFDRPQVEAALRRAFGNPDRAAEYLTTGMPAEEAPSMDATPDEPAGGEGEAVVPQELSEDSPLYFLASNPSFLQLRQLVQEQPHLLPSMLQQIAASNPDLVSLINENQEDFYILLNAEDENGGAPMPGAGGAAGAGGSGFPGVQLTQEEMAAVERLSQLGFDRNLALQAYIACEKDENMAANWLLSNGAGMS